MPGMDRSRRVLIITNHYLNIKTGGSLASLSLINRFGSLFPDCTLIFPDNGKPLSQLLMPGIKILPCGDSRPDFVKGLGIYLGKIHRFGKKAREYIQKLKPDIIVFDTSIVSYGILGKAVKSGTMIITHHHNVETDYFRDNMPHFSYSFAQRHHIRKSEKAAVRNSILNLTLTNNDREKLAELYGENNLHSIRCLGICVPDNFTEINSSIPALNPEYDKIRFVITGSLSFPQSDSSIRRFILNKWPGVLLLCPNAELVISGRNPSISLTTLCNKYSNIRLLPDPVSTKEIIAGSDYYICPVDSGSGFKFRIMEALKSGKPVIAHKVSSIGYERFVENGIINVYDSDESFTGALTNALKTQITSDEIIKMYSEVFSFESGLMRLETVLEALE
jgi:glycosyltransferase involved in cell wall biosynthesis